MDSELPLRYGVNPHQTPARVYAQEGPLPLRVLNGSPSYINLLDALNGWQLVQEMKRVLGLPAAASYKHVSPAGAAVGLPLDQALREAYFLPEGALTPLAAAYARARGADRVSSYGDWVALSEEVDSCTADLLRREVSDGVIAPGYEAEALAVLTRKKNGAYGVLQIDEGYEPPAMELREVFGISFEQKRNDFLAGPQLFENVVTRQKALPDSARRDLLVATIALKYTQSNSVCLVLGGQVIGLGAGQQSRIHCTRLAANKADTWWLRQHPRVRELPFKKQLGRPDRDNAVDVYLLGERTPTEQRTLEESLDGVSEPLGSAEKQQWLDQLRGVALSSDAFFPFRDSIDRAARSGVQYVLQPGGSVRDAEVIEAADEYGMVMAFTGVRLFHH